MKTYRSKGLVYGNLWGGGRGSYPAVELAGPTKKKLLKQARAMLKDGSLDSGMGYESLIGALLAIEEVETIEKDGKQYTRSEIELETIGKLSTSDSIFLFEDYWNRF